MTSHRPAWVAHADWGTSKNKRQVAKAFRQTDGTFLALPPQVFGLEETCDPLSRLGVPTEARAKGIVAGFDFPIGLPMRYAAKIGITSFRTALRQFGSGEWFQFFDVADSPEEITLHRPFYPLHPGQKGDVSWAHLEAGLGIERRFLKRRCEAGGGESLFWTLGGRQVGKAALNGWKTVLQPLLADKELGAAIWPFDGHLANLVQLRDVVILETYPAVFYRHFRFSELPPSVWSKRRRDDRKAKGAALLLAAERIPVSVALEVTLSPVVSLGSQSYRPRAFRRRAVRAP